MSPRRGFGPNERRMFCPCELCRLRFGRLLYPKQGGMRLEVIRVERDETYITALATEIELFMAELTAVEAQFGDAHGVLRERLEGSL